MVRLTKKEVFSTNIKRFWFHKSIIVIKIIRVIVHLLIMLCKVKSLRLQKLFWFMI